MSASVAKAPERCPACASAGGCGCVMLPEYFRQLGFSGLFHTTTTLGPGTYETYKDRAPCLISGDRWVLASVSEVPAVGVVVRRDSDAIVEAFTRPAG
jgi:hypothetical protein